MTGDVTGYQQARQLIAAQAYGTSNRDHLVAEYVARLGVRVMAAVVEELLPLLMPPAQDPGRSHPGYRSLAVDAIEGARLMVDRCARLAGAAPQDVFKDMVDDHRADHAYRAAQTLVLARLTRQNGMTARALDACGGVYNPVIKALWHLILDAAVVLAAIAGRVSATGLLLERAASALVVVATEDQIHVEDLLSIAWTQDPS